MSALVFLVFGVCAWRWLPVWWHRRRLQTIESQLPDALMLMASALASGAAVPAALGAVAASSPAPLSKEWALMVREQRMGIALDTCFQSLVERVPLPSMVLVASAVRVSMETGGGLKDCLVRMSETLRARLQMEGKIRALTSQGVMQAWVVGALPLAMMWVLNVLEPAAMAHLWHTPIGWGVLALFTLLEVCGVYFIRKVVQIEV